jgi:hypothetical protein
MHSLKAKAGLVFSAVMLVALTVAQTASAAITIDAKDFTEPVEDSMNTAAPIVIAFIAGIFALTFIIKWIQRRASSAK